MADVESTSWSATDASNTAATPDGAPNNFARTATKNIFRAIMGGVRRFRDRITPTLSSAGTAPAFTLTYTGAPTLVQGSTFAFKAHDATTGSMTLNVNATGDKKCYDVTGTTQLAAGAFIAGTRIVMSYDTSLDSSAGGFVWLNQGSFTVNNLTAETTIATDDLLAIADTSESGANNKITVANFLKIINALTEDTSPDPAADFVMTYDASASAAKKVKIPSVPVGSIVSYGGTSAPSGWLLCYGQNVSRSTYSALFAIVGTAFGSGDGSTTFGIPDLRGRATFGKDDMGGSAANRVTNAVSGITGTTLGSAGGSQSLTAHTHTFSKNSGTGISPGASGQGGALSSDTTGSTGSGSSENMPPALIVNKIIFAGA